ncbi:MAG: hypothetical protein AAGA48_08185 [Myxococcota bacterium]
MQPTVEDLITRVREATTAAEQARWLEAAARKADDSYGLRALVRTLVELRSEDRETIARAVDRLVLAAGANADSWGLREAAQVRAGLLADPAGALEALQVAEAHIHQQHSATWGWTQLAEAYAELGETDEVRRCMEEARAAATDHHDTYTLVTQWAALLGDPKKAEAMLAEAESELPLTASVAWSLANAWRTLGLPARADRLLGACLDRVEDTQSALTLVAARQSHRDPQGMAQALTRAEALADSAEDWFHVAEALADQNAPNTSVRRALEAAVEAEGASDWLEAVATGYRRWLSDEAAADALGIRGLRPGALGDPSDGFRGLEWSAEGLFDWVRAVVPPSSLQQIARADYGSDADKHLVALKEICQSGLLPRTLPWHPREVLALTRWSQGERVDHHARALSTTILSLYVEETELSDTLSYLVESCLQLGPKASEHADRFLVWACACTANSEFADNAAAPIALALLRLVRNPSDPLLPELTSALSQDVVDEMLRFCTAAKHWSELVEALAGPHLPHHEVAKSLAAWFGIA